jgi:hypothetical protein
MEQDLYLEELAAKIEQQRAKIRALQLEVEKRRQSEERYRNERLTRMAADCEEDRRQAKLRETEQKEELLYQQEEQRYRDRQARDKSAIQAYLCHKGAEQLLSDNTPLFYY